MRLNSKQIVLYTGGSFLIEPIDASEILTGITWDSRNVRPGDLYVALRGERVDGHEFVEGALRAGARGALVTVAPSKGACVLARELGVPIIEVSDTMHAIEDLAREWRHHITAKVVAVTGSVGKTTTKNLVRDVCAAKYRTVATEGNQNNELGVPNTVLAANPDTDVVVVEMGMRGLGQIKQLCDIARPDWGLISNVGECHMELLGTKENIMRAKRELHDALPDGSGIAFLNAEDACTDQMAADARLRERHVRMALFGGKTAAGEGACKQGVDDAMRVWARDVRLDAEGRPEFVLCVDGVASVAGKTPVAAATDPRTPALFALAPDAQEAHCHLSVRGEHNVTNACSAAAVGLALGIDISSVVEALSESLSEAGRLEMLTARDGFVVINDAYNANPDSMKAALGMLAAMDVRGRRIAVLGDMGELGAVEVACHRGVGEVAARLAMDELICIGGLSQHIADAAIEAGMPEAHVFRAMTLAEAFERIEGNLMKDDVVLVKASHFMRLDRLVEGLVS